MLNRCRRRSQEKFVKNFTFSGLPRQRAHFSRQQHAKKQPLFAKIRQAGYAPLPDFIGIGVFQMRTRWKRQQRFVPTSKPENVTPDSELLRLPDMPQGTAMSLLGVDYFRLKTDDGGELFLTRFGLPFWKYLLPKNWYAHEWFEANRERLEGTSTVYRVPTRPVDGKALDLVVKWSRVGEVVPLDTLTVNKFIHAEFNSPFEEFSLLMELRRGDAGPRGIRVRTQQPLAIYVPGQRPSYGRPDAPRTKSAPRSPAIRTWRLTSCASMSSFTAGSKDVTRWRRPRTSGWQTGDARNFWRAPPASSTMSFGRKATTSLT